MRLLLVEDDPELSAILTDGLKEQGMDVAVAPTFGMGRTLAASNSYDLIILDVMLPGGSGFDLCRTIRDAGVGAPILILTAKDGVDDRVTGLDAGADDYLTKPFAFRELLARVRALNRRPHSLLPKKVVVVDRASITAHVWDENHDPFTNVLEVLVRRLRRKIDDGFEPKLIHTLRGAGYRLGV